MLTGLELVIHLAAGGLAQVRTADERSASDVGGDAFCGGPDSFGLETFEHAVKLRV